MFPSTSILATASMASLALGQTSTVTLYVPGADVQSLVGAVAGIASSLTTYILSCDNPTDDCGFVGPFTMTENASTAKYTMGPENGSDGVLAFTARIDCSLDSTVSAVCVESFGGTEANFPGQRTETYTGTDFFYMPVVLTAGTGSLPETASATTTSGGSGSASQTWTGSASVTGSSSGGSSNGAAKTQTTASGTAAATSSSAGGGPVVMCAKWVVAGAAAVGVMALMI